MAVTVAAVQLHDGDGPLHGARRARMPLVVAQPCGDKGERHDDQIVMEVRSWGQIRKTTREVPFAHRQSEERSRGLLRKATEESY